MDVVLIIRQFNVVPFAVVERLAHGLFLRRRCGSVGGRHSTSRHMKNEAVHGSGAATVRSEAGVRTRRWSPSKRAVGCIHAYRQVGHHCHTSNIAALFSYSGFLPSKRIAVFFAHIPSPLSDQS